MIISVSVNIIAIIAMCNAYSPDPKHIGINPMSMHPPVEICTPSLTAINRGIMAAINAINTPVNNSIKPVLNNFNQITSIEIYMLQQPI